jgi:hypothetical protein
MAMGGRSRLGDPILCDGIRKDKTCGGHVFKCANPECNSTGCEKSECSQRQFTPIQKCKDCGRSYERIQQYGPARAPGEDVGSTVPGRRFALPNVELLFAGILGLVVVGAALAGALGVFAGPGRGPILANSSSVALPSIGAAATTSTPLAYADVCQCYREGMSLAGKGVSVLDSQYRVGFVQCRAAFGAPGGDAWTSGWNARVEGKLAGAGCRTWMRSYGG